MNVFVAFDKGVRKSLPQNSLRIKNNYGAASINIPKGNSNNNYTRYIYSRPAQSLCNKGSSRSISLSRLNGPTLFNLCISEKPNTDPKAARLEKHKAILKLAQKSKEPDAYALQLSSYPYRPKEPAKPHRNSLFVEYIDKRLIEKRTNPTPDLQLNEDNSISSRENLKGLLCKLVRKNSSIIPSFRADKASTKTRNIIKTKLATNLSNIFSNVTIVQQLNSVDRVVQNDKSNKYSFNERKKSPQTLRSRVIKASKKTVRPGSKSVVRPRTTASFNIVLKGESKNASFSRRLKGSLKV